jgi:hypothetical protein
MKNYKNKEKQQLKKLHHQNNYNIKTTTKNTTKHVQHEMNKTTLQKQKKKYNN